jgi:hypothetical protein
MRQKTSTVSLSRKRSSQAARTLIQVLVSMQALTTVIMRLQIFSIRSSLTIMAMPRMPSM